MSKNGLTRRALILSAPSLLMPAAALSAAKPTPSGTEGPFYPTSIPDDNDADLVRVENALREAGGDILHLGGRVLDTKGRPVGAARVEIWQCDVNGVYLHSGDRRHGSRDKAFQGFGHTLANSDGGFSFRTIVPVPYPGRTPHIHVKVLLKGRHVLTTQLYKANHPQNAGDFLFRRLGPGAPHRVSMQIEPRTGSPRPTFETNVNLVVRT